MLACMHVCGFCHMFFLVRCRENFLKILEPWSKFMIATMKMHNEEPIESFEVQIYGVMAVTVHAVKD